MGLLMAGLLPLNLVIVADAASRGRPELAAQGAVAFVLTGWAFARSFRKAWRRRA